MPYVPVPKDLNKVKTKAALNLTKRQLVCFGIGGLVGIPIYLLAKGSIGSDSAALLMIALMLPFFAFGVYEKDGQPLEKVLMNYIRAAYLRPKIRPYRTDNGYAALMRQAEREGKQLENKTTAQAGKKPAGRKNAVQKRKGRRQGIPPETGREPCRRTETAADRGW